MFRDPKFFNAFREQVVPLLKTYPSIKIWHAGCSTGDEVFSCAILLHEEGLLERTTLFGTDVNKRALKKAKEGIYTAENMKLFTRNYQACGGKQSLSDYYSADYGLVRIQNWIQKKISFFEHNLVTDQVFLDCHVIFCRNVLIYFKRDLQNHVTSLLTEGLLYKGFLCLGTEETTQFLNAASHYDMVNAQEKIFQKKSSERRNAFRVLPRDTFKENSSGR